jgi:ribosomal protein S18 acetylase RimI-like enzyme
MAPVRNAKSADGAGAIETLARAFDADPPLNWVIRQDSQRAKAFREFFGVSFHRMTLPFGCVDIAGDYEGVALWTPPGKWQLGLLDELAMLPAFLRVLSIARFPSRFRGINKLQSHHPKQPHYYLFAMGVKPELQGRGVGSVLLKHRLATCDLEKMPAYLEASTPGSRALYERLGFVSREEIRMADDAPPVWAMWREAR